MPTATGHERTFGRDEIIVSKTDPQGRITYANDVFLRVAGYGPEEILNAPHSILRHPDMPRSVFKLAWDRIQSGQEIFAYVKNLAKNGDYYWVFAHITPTFDDRGKIVAYHSNRRCPDPSAVATVSSLYAAMLGEEKRQKSKADAIAAGTAVLERVLSEKGTSYDELVFAITED
jgi:PAS domain S-box-containing protein